MQLDRLYATLKSYNYELLEKSNAPFYIGANFYDAIDLAITSNALSLIKGKFQTNHYSITNALNLRNLIECFTLLSMDEKGDITDVQKELFVEQYKIIEYESYAKGDSDKYESLLDKKDLKFRYESGKAKFLEVLGDEKKLKKIVNSRLPFLCDEKLNFNILIKNYCPEYLDHYINLSRMVHPSSYHAFRNIELYNRVYWIIMRLVIDRYKDMTAKPDILTYSEEQIEIYKPQIQSKGNYSQRMYDIQKGQWQILKKIAEEFKKVDGEDCYVKDFINELTMVIHDVNTDSHLGYTENVKLKFKVIAEMFACFYRIYVPNEDCCEYLCTMQFWHDVIKDKEHCGKILEELKVIVQQNEQNKNMEKLREIIKEGEQSNFIISDEERDAVYQCYLKHYPSSKLTGSKFFKEFDKPLGFLVDGEGNTPNYVQIVDEYFEKLFGNASLPDKEVKVKDFFKLVYKESNNMSHGCGYLFFTNIGAWMDEKPVIQFLDSSILYFLNYLFLITAKDSLKHVEVANIALLLRESSEEMRSLINTKTEILKKKSIEKKY